MACVLHGQRLSAPRSNRDIYISGIRCDAFHRALLSPEAATHQAHMRAVIVSDLRDLGGFHLLVTRRGPLERRGQIGPELEAVHASSWIALWHLLMDNPAASSHPLDVARRNRAAIAHAVTMLHRSSQHISNGFNPPMRMPGKAREVVFRNFIAEVVKKQKRIIVIRIAKSKSAAQMDPCSLHCRFGLNHLPDRSNGHGNLQREW